jgi:hypothetical protein
MRTRVFSYTGLDRHAGQSIGLFDTVLSRSDYDKLSAIQESSTVASKHDPNDVPTDEPSFVDDETEETDGDGDDEPIVVVSKPYDADREPLVPEQAKAVVEPVVEEKPHVEQVKMEDVVVGAKVSHAKFGIGSIVSLQRNVIGVDFGEGHMKWFQVPMSLENGTLKIVK